MEFLDTTGNPGEHFMRTQRCLAPALAMAVLLMGPSCSKRPAQSKFATPDDAAKTLLQALKSDNMEQIAAIFGRETLKAVASGDPAGDKYDREVVAVAMEQAWRWTPLGSDRK